MSDPTGGIRFIDYGWAVTKHGTVESLHMGPRAKIMATRNAEDYGGEVVRVAIYVDPKPTP